MQVTGDTGEQLVVVQPLDEDSLRTQLQAVLQKGISALTVLLLHSYT